MESLLAARGFDAVVLMVTDIVREGSEILAVGNTQGIERALGITLDARAPPGCRACSRARSRSQHRIVDAALARLGARRC